MFAGVFDTQGVTRSPRVPFQRLVRVRSLDGRGPSRRLWAMNLSVGGMFIRSADPLPVGTRVRIEVEWAATVVDLAEAEVVWSRSTGGDHAAGFGLRFVEVAAASQQLLADLVRQNGKTSALREARQAAAS
jgi:uncharacterized protein (TIGR02266 family)